MINETETLLVEDERVLDDARIHGIVFAPTVFYIFVGLLAALFYHPILGGVILLLTLYPLYTASVHYLMTHLILTDKKVMARTGFISRDWVQMAFERIENAHLEEPILGRTLGYSTVIISGVGTGAIAIPYVINGDQFIRELESQLDVSREENKPQDFSVVIPELRRIAAQAA